MADNPTIYAGTTGSTVVVGADEVTIGGTLQQVQRMKLVDGSDGGTGLIGGDAANGLDVDVTRVSGNVTVVQGTAANLKVDASGVAVPITDNGGSLTVDAPVGTPVNVRLSDGAANYDGAKTGQLPSALVGGRLDENVGAWLGSTAPTVGSKTSANSVPVVIASDQGSVAVTADTELPAAAALADATANPTTTVVGAMNELFNGTTWDRARGDTTTGAYTNVKAAVFAGTDAASTQPSVANVGGWDGLNVRDAKVQNRNGHNVLYTYDSALLNVLEQILINQSLYQSIDPSQIPAPLTVQLGGDIALTAAKNTGGMIPYKQLSTASTNTAVPRVGPSRLMTVVAINTTGTIYYLKFFDKSTTPTLGTDVPVLTFPVPASTTGAGEIFTHAIGFQFFSGIALALTGAIGDSDSSNAAAGVAINLGISA